MSQPIRLESVDQVLLDQSIKTGIRCAFVQAEALIAPLIELIGIDPKEKAYLEGLARLHGDYPIDAEDMMKELGIVAQETKSKDIARALVRANIIPKLDLKKLVKEAQEAWGPAGPHGQDPKFEEACRPAGRHGLLFTNYNCKVVRMSEFKQGREYHSFKYKLTINAAHKVLMRAYNDDKYADYFSIQLQLIEKYKKYQADYEIHMKNNELRKKNLDLHLKDRVIFGKDDKIDQLQRDMKAMLLKADHIIDQNSNLTSQNQRLVDTTDRMEKRQIVMARDIKTMINLFNNIGFTPEVVKQIIELHGGANNNGSFAIDGDRPWQYVEKCKLFIMCSWYNHSTSKLIIRVAARNFNTVAQFYKDIETENQTFARTVNHTITYHSTQVIALCDQDVNAEYSTFEPVLLRHAARKSGGKSKKYEVGPLSNDAIDTYLNALTTELRSVFCMRHQHGIRKLLDDTTLDDEQRKQVISVRDQHTTFNQNAIEWCQMFVDGSISHLRNGMQYRDDRLHFPKMTGLAKTYRVDGTNWRAMDILKYAMTMFKICIRDFSHNEYIREIIHNDLANDALQVNQ